MANQITDYDGQDKHILENKLSSAEITNKLLYMYFQVNSLEELLIRTLNIIADEKMSSKRFLLLPTNISNMYNKAINGEGPKSEMYAYLDNEIIDQLADRQRIFVPDTTKFRTVKFIPDKPYPRSILGFSLNINQEYQGILWFAFEEVKEITRAELKQYERILDTLSIIVRDFLDKQKESRFNRFFRGVLDQIDSPILLLDESRNIIFANQTAKNTFMHDIEWSKKQEGENKEFLDVLFESEPGKELFLSKDGNDFRGIVNKLFDNDRLLGKSIILSNQTFELRQNKFFNLMIDVINQDLKAALIEIQGYSKIIPMIGSVNEKQVEYINCLALNTSRSISLVDDLFSIKRFKGNEGIKIKPVKLIELVDQALMLLEPTADQNRINIIIEKESFNNISVFADQTLITHAIYNIIKYAILNSNLGSEVEITRKLEMDNCVISIKDSGKGFSKVDIENFPDGDYQKNEIKELVLVWRIMRLHDGSFKIKSELGEGSEYIIELPLKKS